MAFVVRFFQRGIAKRRLGSEKEIDRVKAAMTLWDVGTPGALENLMEGMQDISWNVRNACARAISKIYEKEPKAEIIEMLHKRAKDADLAEKLAIIEALGQIGHDDSLAILLHILKTSKADLQYAVIMALSNWAELDLLPALIQAGETKDYLTRRAAMMTSYNIIADAIPNTTLPELLQYFQWIVKIYVETGYLGPLIIRFLELPIEEIDEAKFPVALNEYEFSLINELLDEIDFDPHKYEVLRALAYPKLF